MRVRDDCYTKKSPSVYNKVVQAILQKYPITDKHFLPPSFCKIVLTSDRSFTILKKVNERSLFANGVVYVHKERISHGK